MKRKLLISLAVAVVFALALPLAGCAKPAETLTLPEGESEVTTELTRASGAFEDKTIVCKDCGGEFIFSAEEQQFYADKGFQNEPARCKACRQKRKDDRQPTPPRELYDATCSYCGAPTKVPFEPTYYDKPIYCSTCLQARREQ